MKDETDSLPKDLNMSGLYENYFLDYASYVILERAVPALLDGLKPVQRRILHSMKQMDDGRYHKVANIIGQTMQYHPHGDAAIGDALVNLGQKNLLIDCQGNWGDVRTGDSAAAPRYIEARLTKFALEVLFNPQTTEWQLSYDGRNMEPVHLPVKFPLVLAQGVEGIAVGLSTRLLPHNFIELVQASISVLKNEPFELYPDFETGGMIDISNYNKGKRGGKVRVRGRVEIVDKKTLAIREIPYGTTTGSVIESILKANDKGVIKVKKVVDNTAEDLEILIELAPNTSPDLTIDALYAFTDCEVSVSPNACVIYQDKPWFMDVDEILRISTNNTKELLKRELEIKLGELQEKWHFASLEKIFIENRVYHHIEECETWEEVIATIDREMRKYIREPEEEATPGDNRLLLTRAFTEEDILKLTEIKIKRISKFNSIKADELIKQLEADMKQVRYDLKHLTAFTIDYFNKLLEKYGKGRERKTQILTFDTIEATQVVANNAKLYINREEGFIGMGLKKDEFLTDCSDIDDIIAFRKDGKCIVSRIGDKVFVGKDIIHAGVWKKGDERTTYNLIYVDGKSKRSFVKRFNVSAVIRDKEYDLTSGEQGSQVLYFSANPNGEAEIVQVTLHPRATARKKQFDYDFSELEIKGRNSKGNTLTKYPVRKVEMKEAGKSTLGAMRFWYDDITGRLNSDGRGKYLGGFDTGDQLLIIYKDGNYEIREFDPALKITASDVFVLEKFHSDTIISAVYFEGDKGWTQVKRFRIETSSTNQKFNFIGEHNKSRLLLATTHPEPLITYKLSSKSGEKSESVSLNEFIDVKGWKALGNRLSDKMIAELKNISPAEKEDLDEEVVATVDTLPEGEEQVTEADPESLEEKPTDTFKTGDSIEFDIGPDGQTKLF
jgi:topoisomerase IV subunit A